jgi:tetratricopeptide (TPR) repeat protein
VPRLPTAVALAAAVVLLGAGVAGAQQPAPPEPAPTTPTTPRAPAGPPALESLRLPAVVSAQQGHARFLAGVRLSTRAKLTVQLVSARDDRVVQTTTDRSIRPAGRAYVRIEAVDSRGFQLLQGAYKLRIQATDGQGRVSRAVEGPFRLRLTAPRGLLDVYTIPVWRAFRRQAGTDAAGQLVVVVAPKGTAAKAGIRRGDVITSIGGRRVGTAGALAAALRALPAETAVEIELVRGTTPRTVTVEPPPDWERAPEYEAPLRVATRREPKVFAYAVARARQLLDAGKATEAAELIAGWQRSWRRSAPGYLMQAELLAAAQRWKPALGAYSRARKADRTLSAAEFGRGIALSELGRSAASARAFAAAARLDPGDPAAAGFQAYALLRIDRIDDAVAAAQRAVALDNRYPDAFLPLGIALLTDGDTPGGIRALRRGLILLEEPDRVSAMLRRLDRADP